MNGKSYLGPVLLPTGSAKSAIDTGAILRLCSL